MFKTLALVYVLVALQLMTNAANSRAKVDANIKSHALAVIRGNRDIADDGYIADIPGNPVEIFGDDLLNLLCENNEASDYQNPFNCTQFIMCYNDGYDYRVFLGKCDAAAYGQYTPTADLCNYQQFPAETCPFPSIWSYPDGVSCETLGQRPWGGNLTFPADPTVRCGSDIVYCKNYTQVGDGSCASGFGYSKAYLACLPLDKCNEADDYFGL